MFLFQFGTSKKQFGSFVISLDDTPESFITKRGLNLLLLATGLTGRTLNLMEFFDCRF